nr:MAG TPA: hypothetical protein [Caudoviricetes sp.]
MLRLHIYTEVILEHYEFFPYPLYTLRIYSKLPQPPF